ncbi:hypothetical protein niasHS_008306 [Heterodera schachtii]|uniref:MULE transposase domain-containing protein n=1 Tax=Heterodera schachtii TaxID=97005 RepID=A0ABD2IX07_HETSC
MKSIRKQIEQQLRRKAPKRADRTTESTTSDDDDKENRPLIEFQRGTTERGSFCIWHKGFRFTRIRGQWFRCSNRDFISDFEIATIRAMRETFPAAQLTGCLFHMSQAVFRKWRETGLAELYANDEEQGEGARNSFSLRKLLALALIPEQHLLREGLCWTNRTRTRSRRRRFCSGR